MNIQDAIAWTVLVGVVFYVFHSHARQDEELYILAYGEYGSRHGGIPLPVVGPKVEFVTQAKLCAEFRKPPDCILKGFYREGHIFLLNELDFTDPHDSSVFIHETVHFLQDHHKGPIHSHAERCRREAEAHHIQYTILMKARQSYAAARVRHNAKMSCR